MNTGSIKLKKMAFFLIAISTISNLSATVFNLAGSPNDTDIISPAGTSTWIGQPSLRVGYDGGYRSVFHIFEMPSIPEGETVVDATLTFELLGVNTFNAGDIANLDIFGLAYRSTTAVTLADHYSGAYGDASDTGIQDDILVRLSSTGTITTDTTGSANIVSYVNTQVDGGASSGDFLIFRYNVDDSVVMGSSGSRYYSIATANHTTEAFRPVLTLTTAAAAVPEVSTYAVILGFVSLVFMVIRRRFRQS